MNSPSSTVCHCKRQPCLILQCRLTAGLACTACLQDIVNIILFNVVPQMIDIVVACTYLATRMQPWVAAIVLVTVSSYVPLTVCITERRGRVSFAAVADGAPLLWPGRAAPTALGGAGKECMPVAFMARLLDAPSTQCCSFLLLLSANAQSLGRACAGSGQVVV